MGEVPLLFQFSPANSAGEIAFFHDVRLPTDFAEAKEEGAREAIGMCDACFIQRRRDRRPRFRFRAVSRGLIRNVYDADVPTINLKSEFASGENVPPTGASDML